MKNLLKRSVLLLLVLAAVTKKSQAQSILDNTQLRFFADAGFMALRDSTDKLAPAFQFGGIELLLTSQVTDKISVLAEPVLRSDGTVSMERLMLRYSPGNAFNISAGRLYTPLGLWNTTFFRYAKALTPTIDAPQIIANTEEGGTALNKDAGIEISGDDIGKIRFGYKAMIGNGYAVYNSPHKALYFSTFIEPKDNLKFALSGNYAKVPAGVSPVLGAVPVDFSYYVIAASAMYMNNKKFEGAFEIGRSKQHSAYSNSVMYTYYGYAGYKIKKTTPYLEYYQGVRNVVYEYDNLSVGVRHNFSALSVIKTEVQLLKTDDFSKINQFKILWAIGF